MTVFEMDERREELGLTYEQIAQWSNMLNLELTSEKGPFSGVRETPEVYMAKREGDYTIWD